MQLCAVDSQYASAHVHDFCLQIRKHLDGTLMRPFDPERPCCADEKGGGKPRTDASSPASVAQQGDIGDDRGGNSGAKDSDKKDPNMYSDADGPDTVTAHDPDTGEQSTSEKVGSAQRSRQPADLSKPTPAGR